MNNHIQIAGELIRYFDVNRRCGHTSAVMAGAFETDALVVVHDMAMSSHIIREWNMLEQPSGADTITLEEVASGKLRGTRRPLLIDNHALQVMLCDLVRRIDTLEAKNVKLEQKINRVWEALS